MQYLDPFEKCPVYETESLLFTKVKEDDAETLFQCYLDPITISHMNNDNCGGDWDVSTIEVVKKGIRGLESEFDAKFYIDFDIKNIVIKADKADLTRVLALKNNNFNKYEENSIIKYDDYYFRKKY